MAGLPLDVGNGESFEKQVRVHLADGRKARDWPDPKPADDAGDDFGETSIEDSIVFLWGIGRDGLILREAEWRDWPAVEEGGAP